MKGSQEIMTMSFVRCLWREDTQRPAKDEGQELTAKWIRERQILSLGRV